MLTKHLLIALSAAALATLATPSRAQTLDDASFSGMWKMDYIDGNKDGMVSKAEFLAMMGKVWDMKAKEMKAKPAGMSAAEFKQFYGFLSRGNNTR